MYLSASAVNAAFIILFQRTNFAQAELVSAPNENEGLLEEDMDSYFMSMSLSMSASMPFTDGPDCAALQQMDPRSISGSDLMIIRDYCDEGLLSTADEVAEAIDAFELPGNPSIDEQFAAMANETCGHASNETHQDFAEVQAACAEDPRDDEAVIDALTRLSARYSPEHGMLCYSLFCLTLY